MTCAKYKLGSEIAITLRVLNPENGQPLDVSSGVNLTINFQTGDSALIPKIASFTTDGTDGKIQYTVVGEELGVGRWKAEGFVEIDGKDLYTTTAEFEVVPRLTVP